MNRKLLPFLFHFFPFCLAAQTGRYGIEVDTILIRKEMLNREYYLQRKKLNIHVMDWFMSDYKEARQQIKSAMFADNLSVIGYSAGALSLLGGMFVLSRNNDLGQDLIKIGGISIGGGVLFQVVSNVYKKRAVDIYNEKIKGEKVGGNATLQIKFSDDGVGVVVGW